MTEKTVKPDGVEVHISKSGHVVAIFTGCDIPPVRFTPEGAMKAGSIIQSGGDKADTNNDFEE